MNFKNDFIIFNNKKLKKMEQQLIKEVFENKRNVLLSGSGGTGKSYLLVNLIKKLAEEKKKEVAITSTTGVTALNIGGSTIHRWSGIKLGKESYLTIINNIRTYKKTCLKNWRNTDILIIDEISMLGQKTLELLDKVGRGIREIDLPFGGLQLLFSGDFLQLPPVQDEFAFKSEVWEELNLRYFILTEPKRHPNKDFFNLLQRVRMGEPTKEDIKVLKSRYDAYLEYIASGRERKEEIKPTRICALKKDVEKHNLNELAKLPGENVTYVAKDRFTVETNSKGDEEGTKKVLSQKDMKDYSDFLDTVVDRTLVFKPGAQVMLTYNLDLEMGLANGSRGVVKSCEQDGIMVLFRNNLLIKIVQKDYDFKDGKVKMVRYQYPLILSWSNSSHKNQGSTLDYVIADLGPTIFTGGQAYVILSRVRELEGLMLSSIIATKIYADPDALEFEKKMIEGFIEEENNKISIKGEIGYEGEPGEYESDEEIDLDNIKIEE